MQTLYLCINIYICIFIFVHFYLYVCIYILSYISGMKLPLGNCDVVKIKKDTILLICCNAKLYICVFIFV